MDVRDAVRRLCGCGDGACGDQKASGRVAKGQHVATRGWRAGRHGTALRADRRQVPAAVAGLASAPAHRVGAACVAPGSPHGMPVVTRRAAGATYAWPGRRTILAVRLKYVRRGCATDTGRRRERDRAPCRRRRAPHRAPGRRVPAAPGEHRCRLRSPRPDPVDQARAPSALRAKRCLRGDHREAGTLSSVGGSTRKASARSCASCPRSRWWM